jgi:hypothetical protein
MENGELRSEVRGQKKAKSEKRKAKIQPLFENRLSKIEFEFLFLKPEN